MTELKSSFVQLLCESRMIRFGKFQTKAGRMSPYFINSGMISRADHVHRCGEIYAKTLIERFGNRSPHLYGPAYKGIPLVTMTAGSLGQIGHNHFTCTFNRKEAKDHGEKGVLVGHELKPGDNVIVIEDVLSRGSSFQETVELLGRMDVGIAGLLVGVDRQEKGFGDQIASDEINSRWSIPVESIISMSELTEILKTDQKLRKEFGIDDEIIASIEDYRRQWNSNG